MRHRSLATSRGTDYAIIRHKALTGTDFNAEVACAPIRWNGAPANMIILRDVTGRLESEQKLRESEQRHRDLIESAPDAMYVQVAGRIVYMNAACRNLFAFGDDEGYQGQPALDFIHPDNRNEIAKTMRDFLDQKTDVDFVE